MAHQKDVFFMAKALQLAGQGRYTTSPNPRVGCLLVKNGTVIGAGWHVRAGGDHAEIAALKSVHPQHNSQGATAYVTLEPCSHYGRTPPCSDALINAGISRVVAAMPDPNPVVAGRGLEKLQAAGIAVTVDVLADDASALNRGFVKRMTLNRPFVRSKLAMSLDGRTAMASGESQWITSPQARADVHRLRAESSAILTGVNTVLADNPSLTARVSFPVTQPLRVILDSQLQTPPTAQMAALPGRSLILACTENADKLQCLQQAGFEVHSLPGDNGRLSLSEVMHFLAEQQVNEVLVEAGAVLNGALLAADLIDELVVYMAPSLMGHQGRGLFYLPEMLQMTDKKALAWQDIRQVGTDLRLTLTPHRQVFE